MFPFPFSFISGAVPDVPVDQVANAQTMSFNGVDSYVAFPNLTLSNNEYTISIWINAEDTSNNAGYFLTNGNTISNAAGFKVNTSATNTLRLEYWSGSAAANFGSLPSFASWNHIAFVCNVSSNSIIPYINGSPGSAVTTATPQTMYNLIGAYLPASGGNRFKGKLDEVAIFNTALSSEKITQIYDATAVVDGEVKTANLFTGGLSSSLVYWNRMGDS